MIRNVGDRDRMVRIAAGIVLLAVMLLAEGPWRWLGLPGIVLLVTGLVRSCPAYALMGVSTRPDPGAGRDR